jgi:branched-chain amino acid transport system substrate-binding protein
VLIATSQSPHSLAVVPLAAEAKIPHISLASSHAIVTPVKERHWTFKTPQSNIHVAVHWVKYLKAKGIKKIASLYVNDAFGEDSRRGLAALLRGTDIQVVYEDKFEHTDKDMTPQLTKVKASGADALIVHAIPPAASIITKNFKDLGLPIPMLHNHGVGNKAFIDLAGGGAEGVLFPAGKLLVAESLPDADPQKKALLDFVNWYEKGLGKPRSTFAGHAWDALQLTRLALATVRLSGNLPADRAAIRDGLEGIRGFAGTGGIFNMSPEDHVGLDDHAMVLVRIAGGKWEYFGPEKW